MENIIVKQQLLTNFFTYHPQGGALYDSNGQLVALNKAISEKLAVTEMSDFLFNNLFETNYLSEVQKRYLRSGSVVSHTLPIGFSIIPGINAFTEGNILSSIFSRGDNDRLSMVNQLDVNFEKEWRQGVSNTFGVQVRDLFSNPYVPFVKPDGELMPSVQSTIVRLNTRLSKDEIVVRKAFDKYSLGSDYPIIGVDLAMGVKGLFKNDYEFYRAVASINYDFPISPIGKSHVVLTGGKIFGKVPYPLLKLHEGNATYFYDPYAFSCMNYYEFASDTWLAFFYEHHFKGFFLGKIPLMKKLKWREVFIFKGLIGTLSDKNNGSLPDTRAILLFPEGMSSVSKPYFETGVGIENIFRLFRIDAIWRLTHREDRPGQHVQNFAINFSVHLNF